MIGGDSIFAGRRNAERRARRRRRSAAIGSSLASTLMRDCACRALDALARKRSTKACMCLRCGFLLLRQL